MKKFIAIAVLSVAVLCLGFHWIVNRVYVPEGQSLLLRYKGPILASMFGSVPTAKPGQFAEEGEVGILARLRGPGRHFYCPLWWERTVVDDIVINPGQVGIVRSALGNNLPEDQYLVDGELGATHHKGILRKAYAPGRYRVNPYAYQFQIVELVSEKGKSGQVKNSGWVEIPTGYVGVVTNLTDIPQLKQTKGVQDKVLPPGIYPINGREQQIDIVEIGFRETTIMGEKKKNRDGSPVLDEAGEPTLVGHDSGITFPSNDGFPIVMDFTAIWGVMPGQAPPVIRTFGNLKAVEQKVVLPQTESICRNKGSKYSAVELLVGEDRQKFQMETADAFKTVLQEKDITMLYGLVRHIYIPQSVRKPIQTKFIADELRLTRDQEQLTAREEANLRESEKMVDLEAERIRSETSKLVQTKLAEGRKTVGETHAETTKLVAAVDKQTAELEAQATVVRGEANATAEKMQQEARADKFRLAVEAFGSGDAYNQWVFAEGLPEDVRLNLIFAGKGTFWTDLRGKDFANTVLGKQLQESNRRK